MEVYGEVETYLHAILTSAVDGIEWPASHFGRFTIGEKKTGVY
jgi:hypothetical protein